MHLDDIGGIDLKAQRTNRRNYSRYHALCQALHKVTNVSSLASPSVNLLNRLYEDTPEIKESILPPRRTAKGRKHKLNATESGEGGWNYELVDMQIEIP